MHYLRIPFIAVLLLALSIPLHTVISEILLVPADFETIQDAIDEVDDGDTVLVAEGTYVEMLLIGDQNLTLASEYLIDEDTLVIANTIISGDGAFRPITIMGDGDNEINIIGLTITNGFVGGQEDAGGLFADTSEINLVHNIFSNNEAYDYGAIRLQECRGVIRNNRFVDNYSRHSAGGVGIGYGNFEVEENVFLRNVTEGNIGGLNVFRSNCSIQDNIFQSNSSHYGGGGARVNHSNSVIDNNLFINNVSRDGGGLQVAGNDRINPVGVVVISNNTFRQNSNHLVEEFGYGGAVTVYNGLVSLEIYNNVFDGNIADHRAGGLEIENDGYVHHNIFINNRAPIAGALSTFRNGNDSPDVTCSYNVFINNGPLGREGDPPYYGAVVAFHSTSTLHLFNNDFYGNELIAFGYRQQPNDGSIETGLNYWNHPSGPHNNWEYPDGFGEEVMGDVGITNYSASTNTDFLPIEPIELGLPLNNFNTHQQPVRFSWNPAVFRDDEFDIEYTFELIPEDGDRIFVNAGTDTFITINEFELETAYRWCVYVDLDTLPNVYSSELRTLHFFDERAEPQSFNLISPDSGTVMEEQTVSFVWERSDDITTDDTVSYTLIISTTQDFLDSTVFAVGTDTTFTLDDLEYDNTYFWRVNAEDLDQHSTMSLQTYSLTITEPSTAKSGTVPEVWEILDIYPNPFNASLSITIGIPQTENIRISIYDLLGREVKVLLDQQVNRGYRQFSFSPRGMASEIYFIRASVPGKMNVTRKILLIK
ncbi:MAG: T9SS type A sorting domain-containing protein [Candidatus Electryonea clarkiae]|nr:T9SS type A sorting domain-containing protein [Candidatus Electryonea clarkiae]MDP8285476.1 T9SS type A sorting domain-containing protein [Candidatus Electryonea clarkiae]